MGAGVRRKARWYALQLLYALDLDPAQTVERALATYGSAFDLELDERAQEFAAELVRQTRSRQGELDDVIQSASRNWRLDRMSRVDRNILRLAAYELAHTPDVPTKVVINEAVELAKRFGAAEAPAFVNGILDRIAQVVRKGEPESPPGPPTDAEA
jgi:transcription antitermination protein NusB